MMLWHTSNRTQRFPLCGEDATTMPEHGVIGWSASKRDSGRWRG